MKADIEMNQTKNSLNENANDQVFLRTQLRVEKKRRDPTANHVAKVDGEPTLMKNNLKM